jgi:beta-1,4-mannosyltransferase
VVALSDRWTTLWIVMNEADPTPGDGARAHIPHGHYRDWFAGAPRGAPVPGRLVHFGYIRAYKGVDALLAAFEGLDLPGAALRVVGQSLDADLARRIERACESDPRVTWVDEYVPDEQLATEVSAGELVVLPYADFTNSGSLLLALSLDRPVLVPRTVTTTALADEVGEEWVLTYDAALTAPVLEAAVAAVRAPRGAQPDLSRREWSTIGAAHAEAFVTARQLSRTRGSRGTT